MGKTGCEIVIEETGMDSMPYTFETVCFVDGMKVDNSIINPDHIFADPAEFGDGVKGQVPSSDQKDQLMQNQDADDVYYYPESELPSNIFFRKKECIVPVDQLNVGSDGDEGFQEDPFG